jgi:phosphatidylserine decarboxylase
MFARLFVYLQYVLPRYWLTALIYRLARIRNRGFKNLMITRFVRLYRVDTADVKLDIPEGFKTFNDFFIRELHEHARPIESAPGALVSPADGTLSVAGTLDSTLILQAKGLTYELDDLLATDIDAARAFENGTFATIYLAPYNYHRVHAPFAGRLVAARFIPGDLFSVNAATARTIPGLFRRNERLALHFETAFGPAVVLLVGALNVGSISTPWSGEIRPRKSGTVDDISLQGASRDIAIGDLLGWFNMGSTVIVLLPTGACRWNDELQPGQPLCMGRRIGTLSAADA